MIKLDVNDMRALSFGKYLLKLSKSQAEMPAPLNSASIMSAQDAIELFLTIIADKCDLKSDSISFMGYWDVLAAKGIQLPYKEEMRRLNKCRVMIKHDGRFPSEIDIKRALSSADLFVRNVIESVFGTTYDELSLLQFITFDSVRQLLAEAQDLLNRKDFSGCIEKAAEAFSVLLEEYINSRRANPWNKPYQFSKIRALDTGFNLMKTAGGDIAQYIDNVSQSIINLDEAVKVLALGIDLDSYEFFKMISPNVYSFAGGHRQCYWMKETKDAVSSESSYAQWAFDFVSSNHVW